MKSRRLASKNMAKFHLQSHLARPSTASLPSIVDVNASWLRVAAVYDSNVDTHDMIHSKSSQVAWEWDRTLPNSKSQCRSLQSTTACLCPTRSSRSPSHRSSYSRSGNCLHRCSGVTIVTVNKRIRLNQQHLYQNNSPVQPNDRRTNDHNKAGYERNRVEKSQHSLSSVFGTGQHCLSGRWDRK